MRFNIRTTKKAKSHLRGQPVRIGGETLVEGSVGKSVQGVKATTGGTRHFSDPSCSRFAVVGIAKGFEVIRKKFKNTVKRRKDKHVLENVDSAEREAAADDGMIVLSETSYITAETEEEARQEELVQTRQTSPERPFTLFDDLPSLITSLASHAEAFVLAASVTTAPKPPSPPTLRIIYSVKPDRYSVEGLADFWATVEATAPSTYAEEEVSLDELLVRQFGAGKSIWEDESDEEEYEEARGTTLIPTQQQVPTAVVQGVDDFDTLLARQFGSGDNIWSDDSDSEGEEEEEEDCPTTDAHPSLLFRPIALTSCHYSSKIPFPIPEILLTPPDPTPLDTTFLLPDWTTTNQSLLSPHYRPAHHFHQEEVSAHRRADTSRLLDLLLYWFSAAGHALPISTSCPCTRCTAIPSLLAEKLGCAAVHVRAVAAGRRSIPVIQAAEVAEGDFGPGREWYWRHWLAVRAAAREEEEREGCRCFVCEMCWEMREVEMKGTMPLFGAAEVGVDVLGWEE